MDNFDQACNEIMTSCMTPLDEAIGANEWFHSEKTPFFDKMKTGDWLSKTGQGIRRSFKGLPYAGKAAVAAGIPLAGYGAYKALGGGRDRAREEGAMDVAKKTAGGGVLGAVTGAGISHALGGKHMAADAILGGTIGGSIGLGKGLSDEITGKDKKKDKKNEEARDPRDDEGMGTGTKLALGVGAAGALGVAAQKGWLPGEFGKGWANRAPKIPKIMATGGPNAPGLGGHPKPKFKIDPATLKPINQAYV
jgi:hypothetical protein